MKVSVKSICAVIAVVCAFTTGVAQAGPVTLQASMGSDGPLSFSWLHSASPSGGGGPDGGGFYMNGAKSEFLPFEFFGVWDDVSKLTISGTSTIGVINTGLGNGIDGGDEVSFVGGVLERTGVGDVVRGFIQYEIRETGAGALVDDGFFFVWGSAAFAGSANSLTVTGSPGSETLTLTSWANNWVNGVSKDWSFLNSLDSDFVVTTSGGDTTSVTYQTNPVLLTSDGTRPASGIKLGIDLRASGLNTAIAPLPVALWSGLGLMSGLGLWKFRRDRLTTH